MRGNPFAEKRVGRALTGAIKKLRREQHVARLIFFLQTANCGHANDPAHVERTQRPDVGAMIQLVWQEAVTPPMPRQKINMPASHGPADNRVGRCPERSLHVKLCRVGEAFHSIKTATPDDSDGRFAHESAIETKALREWKAKCLNARSATGRIRRGEHDKRRVAKPC